MPLPSVRRRDIATRVGLTIGGGGAGWLGAIAVIHQPGTAAVAAVVVAAALATSVAEVIFTSLPEIIKARGEAKKEIIRETAEAKAILMRAETRTALLRAGVEPGKAAQADDMLRRQAIDTDLPEGRRLNDEALVRLLTAPRTRKTGTRPDNGPKKPDNGSSRGNVFPIRPEQ